MLIIDKKERQFCAKRKNSKNYFWNIDKKVEVMVI